MNTEPEFTEEQLLAFDRAYARDKDSGALQRREEHQALEEQVQRERHA